MDDNAGDLLLASACEGVIYGIAAASITICSERG